MLKCLSSSIGKPQSMDQRFALSTEEFTKAGSALRKVVSASYVALIPGMVHRGLFIQKSDRSEPSVYFCCPPLWTGVDSREPNSNVNELLVRKLWMRVNKSSEVPWNSNSYRDIWFRSQAFANLMQVVFKTTPSLNACIYSHGCSGKQTTIGSPDNPKPAAGGSTWPISFFVNPNRWRWPDG